MPCWRQPLSPLQPRARRHQLELKPTFFYELARNEILLRGKNFPLSSLMFLIFYLLILTLFGYSWSMGLHARTG
jgi:hypothetical protein